jgi:hypothetical protein
VLSARNCNRAYTQRAWVDVWVVRSPTRIRAPTHAHTRAQHPQHAYAPPHTRTRAHSTVRPISITTILCIPHTNRHAVDMHAHPWTHARNPNACIRWVEAGRTGGDEACGAGGGGGENMALLFTNIN